MQFSNSKKYASGNNEILLPPFWWWVLNFSKSLKNMSNFFVMGRTSKHELCEAQNDNPHEREEFDDRGV
jgi:hypothetical protein